MERNGEEIYEINDQSLTVLKNLAEEMPGGFFMYKAHGGQELIYSNQAMLRIFECDTMEEYIELIGNSFKGIVHPDDYEEIEMSIQKQIAQSRYDLDYVEYRIITKTGETRWVQDYGHFTTSKTYGDIFWVFIDDATERMRKRIEELEMINSELASAYAREGQYRKAILYDAITFFEINVSKDAFITSATKVLNGRVMNLFDYMGTPHFTRYSDYVSYLTEHADASEQNEFASFFSIEHLVHCYDHGELEQTFTSWNVDSYGRRRLFNYIFLLGSNEKTQDIIALYITKDITDQMEKQRLFEMALKQANAANIARSTFLSDMSHEIRTPLNSIIGFTNLIMSHDYPREKLDNYLDKIRQSSEQLLTIVTESLEITRMESGKATLAAGPCNILDIMAVLEKEFAPEAARKGITLSVEKIHIVHFGIVADAVRICEVLSQLLDNAIKYTYTGGHVLFAVEEIGQTFADFGNYRFVVQDDGIGISEEFQKHLFEPFERENNTTSSGIFGSGLGLVVAKNMLDMMEGRIEVDSEVGKGSTFTITISCRLQTTQNQETVIDTWCEEGRLAGKNILLVEDNAINMEIAHELLKDCGFVIDTAENGYVALRKVQDSPAGTYDAILMDIQMPVMDGYEASRAIRSLQNQEKAQIPIIAVSANAFAEDQEQSRLAGMDGHCPKPIDIVRLKEMIARVMTERENDGSATDAVSYDTVKKM